MGHELNENGVSFQASLQGVRETFSEYMTKWKTKASRMVNRPNENDQINMIIKNLLPAYNSRFLSLPISSFGELCDCGTRIEDAINNGQLEKGESKPLTKKTYGGGTTIKAPNPVNVSAIIPQQTLAYPKKGRREFSNLGMILTQAYENLSSKGVIKPVDPTPMPNPIPSTWKLNEYCHYHQKSNHKTDNGFRLKHEIQDLIDNGTLPNPNIITKPNIKEKPLPDYHRAPPPYQNWVQIDEIEWDCSKLIEAANVNINDVEVQGVWDEKDEILKEAVVVWGILPKGVIELKKRVMEDNVANITTSGKHYKPSFLEKDHLGRDLGEGSKTLEPKEKEDKEEEDKVLMQLNKTQPHVSIWGLLMASQKHRKALLDALNGKKVPIETPQEVLSLMGVEGSLQVTPLLAFSDEALPLEGATHT